MSHAYPPRPYSSSYRQRYEYYGGGHQSSSRYDEQRRVRDAPRPPREFRSHRQGPVRQREVEVVEVLEPVSPPSVEHMGIKIPISAFFPEHAQPIVSGKVVTYTPDTELTFEDEPIEAGRLPKKSRARVEQIRRSSVGSASQLELEGDDAARLKRKAEAFKTALCDAYRKNSECAYGDQCRFAHGEHELQLPKQPRGKAHPKYKTQLCDKFSVNGFCPYGPRCQFIHMTKKGLPLVEYEKRVRSGKISPTRECIEFIDEEDMDSDYTKSNARPHTLYKVDPRRAKGTREWRRSDGARPAVHFDDNIPRGYRSQFADEDGVPTVVYERIPTTPRRGSSRSKELSLIHEETEEAESPPPPKTIHPDWVRQLIPDLTKGPVSSPRMQIKAPAMHKIDENDAECFMSESCDEELLAGAVYVNRYKAPSIENLRKLSIETTPDRKAAVA